MSDARGDLKKPIRFDAYWHLQAIGLLKPSDGGLPKPPTQKRADSDILVTVAATYKGLVAIIDTGVSLHPYLTGRLEPNSGQTAGVGKSPSDQQYGYDLTAAPSLLVDDGERAKIRETELSDEWLKEWLVFPESGDKEPWQEAVIEIVTENIGRAAFNAGAPAASNQKFSAHGTSCAGLVAASSSHFVPSEDSGKSSPDDLPYYRGVDPDSDVLSVTTSFSPRPDLLILAFLLAASKGADVILFPRGLPREILFEPDQFYIENAGRLSGEELRLAREQKVLPWKALKQTILAVSQKIPVVCAAGNESESSPIAPACFAAPDNGIIAVAAMNYYGSRSSYSNYGEGITIAAPSDDAEIFNRDQARLDKTDRFFVDHPYQFYVNKKLATSEVPFAKAGIRAIDVPGPFGFSDTNSNGDAGLFTEPESFFTEFGGTSAAAAIVAGVAVLMQRKAKSKGGRKTGPEIRKLLCDTARKRAFPHLKNIAGLPDLGEDWVDGIPLSFEQKFGAGLVAADEAVKAVLP